MSVIPDCSARRLPDRYLPTYNLQPPRRQVGSYHYLPTSAPPAAADADNYLPTYGTLPPRTT